MPFVSEKGPESPCCCEGTPDYYEVARKLVVSGSQRLVSEMIELGGANTVEIDVEDISHTAIPGYRVSVSLQYSSDAINWISVFSSPVIILAALGVQSGVVTNLSGKFVRLHFAGGIPAGMATFSAGIRLRTDTPILIKAAGQILPGLEAIGPGMDETYFLLADRLHVAVGGSVALAPVFMADRNAVRLEFVVVQPAGLPISARIEGSNDTQTWETLAGYGGIAFGYTAPATLTGVSHRYVRAVVNGPQIAFDAVVELGMHLSKQ